MIIIGTAIMLMRDCHIEDYYCYRLKLPFSLLKERLTTDGRLCTLMHLGKQSAVLEIKK